MVAQQRVVVGVDGSAPSLAAVDWAASDAARRGLPLHILYAFAWPPYAPVAAPAPSPDDMWVQETAAQVLGEAETLARSAAPSVPLTTATHVEPPAVALLRAAADACEVVVGNRGHGGFAGLLLGSVGVQVAAHASCPVVIARHAERSPGPDAGRVVVGVDASYDAAAALRFAFEEASSTGVGLTAVLAYQWPSSTGPGNMLPLAYDPAILAADEQRILAEATAGWRERYPDVDVARAAVRGRAAAVLVDRSAGAHLLVVGSRGRGGFTGLLLGSVSQAAIHHAACPVAVVRPAKQPRP